MTQFLPPKKSIRNFESTDIEGKRLFNQAADLLEGFFSKSLAYDLANSVPYIPGGGALGNTSQARMSHALSEMMHLHGEFQKLIGQSRRHGEDVPTMSHFTKMVAAGRKVDKGIKQLAAEVNDRPYAPEDLAKEAYRNLLLECAILDHCLNQEDAFSAFQEIVSRQQHHASDLFLQLKLPKMALQDTLSLEHKFSALRTSVSHLYGDLQSDLGIALPKEAVQALVDHPMDAKLCASSLDEIRIQFFKLPMQAENTFASRILLMGGHGSLSAGG
ncbi:MAG: hypothetical protein ACOYNL_03020 [Rickettsiales bacterium]